MAKDKNGKRLREKRDVVIDMIPSSIPASADTADMADKEAELIVSFAKVLVPFLGGGRGGGVLSGIVQDPRTPKLLAEFCAFNRARKK